MRNNPSYQTQFTTGRMWISSTFDWLTDEVDVSLNWDYAAFITHSKNFVDSLATIIAIVQGALIDVHADEAVGEVWIQVARELHGILQGGLAVFHSVLNAVSKCPGSDLLNLHAKRAPDSVTSQGKW